MCYSINDRCYVYSVYMCDVMVTYLDTQTTEPSLDKILRSHEMQKATFATYNLRRNKYTYYAYHTRLSKSLKFNIIPLRT